MNSQQAPARRSVTDLLDRVDQAADQLAAYLPENVKPERFMALARRAIAENPDIARCSTTSVLRALSSCAASGLPLDGQFSSLIVRKSKNGPPTATWDPSYRGMTTLALSSGFVTDVQSFVVRELDEFSVEQGTEPKIRHIPSLLPGGSVIAAYAWARLRGGQLVIEVLGAEDIKKIKNASPAGDRGPWGHWGDQMARKSAVRRLLKKLPAGPARFLSDMPEPVSRETPAAPPARIAAPPSLPEDENALECAALERLRNAPDDYHLAAAWAQTQVQFQQAGIPVPASLVQVYEDLQAAGPDDQAATSEHDEWIAGYEA